MDPLTIRLRVFGSSNRRPGAAKKLLKAKALSERSTSSSGEGERVFHREQRAHRAPDGVPFNCFCIYAGFGLQRLSDNVRSKPSKRRMNFTLAVIMDSRTRTYHLVRGLDVTLNNNL